MNEDTTTYNIGSSNYASLPVQPWDVWELGNDSWTDDIVKRLMRTKENETELDREKLRHIVRHQINRKKEHANRIGDLISHSGQPDDVKHKLTLLLEEPVYYQIKMLNLLLKELTNE